MSTWQPSGPGSLPEGTQIASYQIQELIGRGGMAVVYRAVDIRLGRQVALKILAPELARDEAFRLRFIRESRAGAAVDHPNVIPVFEAGEADGLLFIAMRYVSGRDVRALIEREGRLSTDRAVSIISQIASALDAAHGHGLVHRDVKPANMLLATVATGGVPDHVYLSDFGLSKQSLSAGSLTGTGQFLGTIDYMAPEQIEGRRVDGRTDLYALACAAFEMLTGEPPFRREQNLAVMWAQVSAPPPSVWRLRPDLPAGLDAVFAAAMAKSADDRPATCQAFASALRAACGPLPGASPPAAERPPHDPTELAHGLAAGPQLPGGGWDPGQQLTATDQAGLGAPGRGAPGPSGRGQAGPEGTGLPEDPGARPPGQATPRPEYGATPPGSWYGAQPGAAGTAPGRQGADEPAAGYQGASGYPGYQGGGPGYQGGGPGYQGGSGPGYQGGPGYLGYQGGSGPGYQGGPGYLGYQGGSGPGYQGGPGYQPPRGPDQLRNTDQLFAGPGGRPPRQRRRKAPAVLAGCAIVLVLGGAAALVLHLRGVGSGQPTNSPSVSASSGTPSASASGSGVPPPQTPAAVVEAYVNAINRHDYRTAWQLDQARHRAQTFASFEQGFATTQHDSLSIQGVSGEVVTATLTALQTDGTTKIFKGAYTVQNGTIVATAITEVR